jgi:peptidoglycan/xylan/chitin deacetylase (PgdA/CDA1 family)
MLQYAYRPNFPATQRQRTSQEWVSYCDAPSSARIQWPGGARVALWVCPNVLHYEFMPPADPWINSWARMGPPDVMMYGRQDFANRVGFWRMLEVIDRFGLRCTAVLNAEALVKNRSIRDAMVERQWAYLGHGINNTRFVHGMNEADEAAYYRRMREMVHEQTGCTMQGTGGPGPQAATENTPDILASLGFSYHSDWFHDDVPCPLNVRSGRLISLPYAMDVNDAPYFGAAFEADGFVDMAKRHFDVLYREGEKSGKVMCISLHPALFGQAHRIGYLSELFEHIGAHAQVWHTTGDEIARHYLAHHYDEAVAGLKRRPQ